MIPVKVINPAGAVIHGPCTVKLKRDQWERRQAVLGPLPKRVGKIDLDGGLSLRFKYGEELEVSRFEGRMNPAIFQRLDRVTPEAPEAEPGLDLGSDG